MSNMITIVFLVDTSASMNQRIYLADGRRLSLLELAKEAIQFFIKVNIKCLQLFKHILLLEIHKLYPGNLSTALNVCNVKVHFHSTL